MSVFAVIVTYNPDDILLMQQYESIVNQVSGIIYVDNNSQNLSLPTNTRVFCIKNGKNEGLGKAQNQGIIFAKQKGATHILLLDQDSVASSNMVQVLLSTEETFRNRGVAVGLIGPKIRDVLSQPPKDMDAIIFQGMRIVRKPINQEVLSVSYCIASGSLIHMEAFDKVGLIKEELFIDAMDVEWCLRAKSMGYEILMTPMAHLEHRLGNGRNDKITLHSPMREYYICRNNIILTSYSYIPIGYRIRKFLLIPARIIYSLFHGYWSHFKVGVNGFIEGIKFCIRTECV